MSSSSSSIISLATQLAGVNLQTPAQTPLAEYFTSFANDGFIYNPFAPTHAEFKRLRKHAAWDKKPDRFYAAFEREFNLIIRDWKSLCEMLQVTPIPGSITQARKVLFSPMHITPRTGQRVFLISWTGSGEYPY
jgi:hypothetical protein